MDDFRRQLTPTMSAVARQGLILDGHVPSRCAVRLLRRAQA
jgi:hypothetical protein